jgi:hypothetical protein
MSLEALEELQQRTAEFSLETVLELQVMTRERDALRERVRLLEARLDAAGLSTAGSDHDDGCGGGGGTLRATGEADGAGGTGSAVDGREAGGAGLPADGGDDGRVDGGRDGGGAEADGLLERGADATGGARLRSAIVIMLCRGVGV